MGGEGLVGMRSRWIAEKVQSLDRVPSRATADYTAHFDGRPLPLDGVPWTPPAPHVIEAARKAAGENIHPPSSGLLSLREAIARKLERENRISADPVSEIQVTIGAMHAVYVILTTMLEPGDEVAMFSPGFFYYGIVELLGGRPLYIRSRASEDFGPDLSALAERIGPRTKILLLNTPVNPSGYVMRREELSKVADIAEQHDLLIVCDESYEKMIYDDCTHVSIGSFPGVADRTLTVQSFTKAYAMPDWRAGFVAGRESMLREIRKVFEWMVLCAPHVTQRAAQAALEGPQEWLSAMTRDFKDARDVMLSGLACCPGLKLSSPAAGPFVFPDVSSLGIGGQEFAKALCAQYGVPCQAGHCFQADGHVRIPFGAPCETVAEAARRITQCARDFVKKG